MIIIPYFEISRHELRNFKESGAFLWEALKTFISFTSVGQERSSSVLYVPDNIIIMYKSDIDKLMEKNK